MSVSPSTTRNPAETRRKLVAATLRLMLCQGFAATTVDQICAEAGLTKGSFFHYFDTKEAIGRAALDAFAQMGSDLYAPAWETPGLDPLERLHCLFDIMCSFTSNPDEPCVCMVGMLSQEMARTNSAMRKACCGHLTVWTNRVVKALEDAKKLHAPKMEFDSESVAWMLNSLWQGSMLIGKTRHTPQMIVRNIELARSYVDGLFGRHSSASRHRTTAKRLPATQKQFRHAKHHGPLR